MTILQDDPCTINNRSVNHFSSYWPLNKQKNIQQTEQFYHTGALSAHFQQVVFQSAIIQPRRPTNWWGAAKRFATHSKETVVYYSLLAITCSKNVYARSSRSCVYSHVRLGGNNNKKSAIKQCVDDGRSTFWVQGAKIST